MKAFEIKYIAVYDKDIGPDRAADLLWESLAGGTGAVGKEDRPVAVRVEDVAIAENADEVLAELAKDRRKFDWIPDGVTEIPVVREAAGATVKAVSGATVAQAELAPAVPVQDTAPSTETEKAAPKRRASKKSGEKKPARKRKGDEQ